MTITLDLVAFLSLVSAISVLHLAALAWEERALAPLLSRLFVALALTCVWWTLTRGLSSVDLSLRYPALYTASEIFSGFTAPLLLVFTLASIGLFNRWRRWVGLAFVPALAGTAAWVLGMVFIPEAVQRAALETFFAGGRLSDTALARSAPWWVALHMVHTIQLLGFSVASIAVFVRHGGRLFHNRATFEARLLPRIYVAVVVAILLTDVLPFLPTAAREIRLAPLLALPFMGVLYQLMRRRVASLRQLLKEREALLNYLPVRTVDEFLTDGADVLAARSGTAAVLFSDLRDFTTMCERIEPQAVIRWLNRFFTLMSNEILARDGIVLQLMGDGLLAVFGMPTAVDNPCQAAFEAALQMQRVLAVLNRDDPIQPEFEVLMGTGLHHGPLVAGSVGGDTRKMYTVLGDTVNTTQRIEALTKTVGYPILMSRQVHERLESPDRAAGALLGTFDLKGKVNQIEIFAYGHPARGDWPTPPLPAESARGCRESA